MSTADYRIRPLIASDAPALAAAYGRNREHLTPWEPVRPDSFFSEPGQRQAVEDRLADQEAGRGRSWVVVAGDSLVGRIDLSNVARGVFQSCSVGYWIDRGHLGKGLATMAVSAACEAALDWGLHRVEAATVLHNAASQAVLRKVGFQDIGTAPDYLYIAGVWADHRLYQRILHERPPS